MNHFTDFNMKTINNLRALDTIKCWGYPLVQLIETPNKLDEHGDLILEVVVLEDGIVPDRSNNQIEIIKGEIVFWKSDGFEKRETPKETTYEKFKRKMILEDDDYPTCFYNI